MLTSSIMACHHQHLRARSLFSRAMGDEGAVRLANPLDDGKGDTDLPAAPPAPEESFESEGEGAMAAGSVRIVTHDERTKREELNDGVHLVTTHYVLSESATDREKTSWLALSYVLLAMQMVAAGAIMAGAIVPNCTANSHCREGQYCCPR